MIKKIIGTLVCVAIVPVVSVGWGFVQSAAGFGLSLLYLGLTVLAGIALGNVGLELMLGLTTRD